MNIYFLPSEPTLQLPFFYKFVSRTNIDCSEMKENGKWPFYDHCRPFFWPLYNHISQFWGSDCHFEVLNRSKPWLIQKLWLKMQIFPSIWDIVEKKYICVFCIFVSFCVLCHNCCTNHDSDLFSTSKWLSKPQFWVGTENGQK